MKKSAKIVLGIVAAALVITCVVLIVRNFGVDDKVENQTVTDFLNRTFTSEGDIAYDGDEMAFYQALEEKYQDIATEKCIETMSLNRELGAIAIFASEQNLKIEPGSITLEYASETGAKFVYEYTALLNVTREEETKTMEITGLVTLSGDDDDAKVNVFSALPQLSTFNLSEKVDALFA